MISRMRYVLLLAGLLAGLLLRPQGLRGDYIDSNGLRVTNAGLIVVMLSTDPDYDPAQTIRNSRGFLTTFDGKLVIDGTSLPWFGSSPAALIVTKAAGDDPTTNNCVKWVAGGGIGDGGAACGAISGSGTTNYLPKFTGATTLGDSLLSDDGTTLTYAGTGGISVASLTATSEKPSSITPAALPGSPVAGDWGILAGSPDLFWFFNDTAVQYALTKPVDLYGSSPAALLVTKAAGADPTTDHCAKWVAGGQLDTAGAACGGTGASTADTFITISHDADLTAERIITAGQGIAVADGGANSTLTVSMECDMLDTTCLKLDEEFPSPTNTTTYAGVMGTLGWSPMAIGANGVFANLASVIPNLGVFRMTTAAVTAQGSSLSLAGSSSNVAFGALGNTTLAWNSVWIFRMNGTANVTTNTSFYVGYTTAAPNAVPAEFIGLRYDTNLGTPDAAFHVGCITGGSATDSVTTYTVDTGWHKIKIRGTGVAGTIGFTFDANSEVTVATGCPTGGLTAGTVLINRDTTTPTKDVWLDKFAFKITGMTR